jgi:hypothetical protein
MQKKKTKKHCLSPGAVLFCVQIASDVLGFADPTRNIIKYHLRGRGTVAPPMAII